MSSTPRDIVRSQLVERLRPRLRDERIVVTTFAELRKLTTTYYYKHGLGFKSGERHRQHLYKNRDHLAEKDCWFDAEYAVGFKWTSDPLLGMEWFHGMQMGRAARRADMGTLLWAIAVAKALPAQRPQMVRLQAESRRYRRTTKGLAKTTRLRLNKIKIQRCKECGREIHGGQPFTIDGSGGVLHHPAHGGCP